MFDNFLSVAGVPAVESSSHTQIESSIANTNMDPSPSSSIPDYHSAHQYQGSCFSLAVVPLKKITQFLPLQSPLRDF
jgi:hypothetical protein